MRGAKKGHGSTGEQTHLNFEVGTVRRAVRGRLGEATLPKQNESFALAVPIICVIIWPCVMAQRVWRGRAATKDELAAKDHKK